MSYEKKLFLCKACRSFFSGQEKEAESGCPTCKGPLTVIGVDYNQYSNWPENVKNAFKEGCLKNIDKPKDNKSFKEPIAGTVKEEQSVQSASGKFNTPPEQWLDSPRVYNVESNQSGWIKGLKFVSWSIFILFILAGLVLFSMFSAQPMLGLLCFVILFCIGFMSVATMMVFLDMAQDIRTIRSRMHR